MPALSIDSFGICAIPRRADYLVTGNKRHFPAPAFEGTAIVNPAEFARVIAEQGFGQT
jgi:hypothetical protein